MKNFFKGGIIGAIIGLIGGFLFAPKSGKQTRDDIADGVEGLMSSTERELKSTYQDLKKQIDAKRKVAAELSGKARKEVDVKLGQADDLLDTLKDFISSIREGEDVSDTDVKSAVSKAKSAKKNLSSTKKTTTSNKSASKKTKKTPAKKKTTNVRKKASAKKK